MCGNEGAVRDPNPDKIRIYTKKSQNLFQTKKGLMWPSMTSDVLLYLWMCYKEKAKIPESRNRGVLESQSFIVRYRRKTSKVTSSMNNK